MDSFSVLWNGETLVNQEPGCTAGLSAERRNQDHPFSPPSHAPLCTWLPIISSSQQRSKYDSAEEMGGE